MAVGEFSDLPSRLADLEARLDATSTRLNALEELQLSNLNSWQRHIAGHLYVSALVDELEECLADPDVVPKLGQVRAGVRHLRLALESDLPTESPPGSG